MQDGRDNWQPRSRLGRWFESRLPVIGFGRRFMLTPTPRNLNWMWIWGMVLVFTLVMQMATGLALAMHYVPHVDLAFASVEHIMRDVRGGAVIRYIHMNGASLFFLAVYFHVFRSLFYGSYRAPREVTWVIGILLYALMMATAFMGYVLPWGQMSLHGTSVITSLFGAIPFVGEGVQSWLLGGSAVGQPVLNRFYALHYLFPVLMVALVALHVWSFHHTGNSNPSGVPVRDRRDTLPFWPYFVMKDLFALAVVLVGFFALVGFAPNVLGHPVNYEPANPLVTPTHIVPEWYFLPFYAVLRAFTSDLWLVRLLHWGSGGAVDATLMGGLAMLGFGVVLMLAPWLDRGRAISGRYRPMQRIAFWLLVADFALLTWVGAMPPTGLYPTIALWATAYWFAYFLILLPLSPLLERVRRAPQSVAADFARRHNLPEDAE
ncbi:ubiquinol--cytochrome c reductase, cytochrome B [Ketogulonicigenium vulgare]|uniref:cytochrome b n=1 Tax=Ketogulonicigenium vulgare TaxID=92945 RepID=UPI0003041C8E|nr:cytochrome b N-terminal domain-containing protein [Ketogulonicigenium vulgare]ALJ79781.1 cytochrome B [Ketogulonicigenium vulgare]AOZ55933.1 ubiquinol--cytochrome c reductase, cytochrome B [Ketogulonicigenium vulgare]